MKKIILAAAICLSGIIRMDAQVEPRTDINDYLDAYIGTNAKGYLQPAADLLTTNINTGIWDWANIPDKGYFRIKANGMMSIPTESMRTFTGHTSGDFSPAQTVIAPTIIGVSQSIVLHGDNDDVYVFPGGYAVDQVTLGTPQVIIGGFFHSEVSARFLTFPLGGGQGNVDFYGIGGRHLISGYFENSPVDLSVGYYYHHIHAGTYLNTDQHLFSIILGKSGKFFSGHVSAGYQTAMHHLHYDYVDGETMYNAHLDLENSNPFIIEGGAGLRLGPIFVNGAISYAQFYSFAVGAGLTF